MEHLESVSSGGESFSLFTPKSMMASLVTVLDLAAFLLFLYIVSLLIQRQTTFTVHDHLPSPPTVPSPIPWLGHAFMFMFYRKDLFSKCRARYGPTYRILLGGQHMVVVSSPKAIFEVLSKSPKVLGPPATQQLSTMTDIAPERFPYISQVSHQYFYTIATGGLAKANMGTMALPMSRMLFDRLHAAMPADADVATTSLDELIVRNFYVASAASLFGSDEFHDTFEDFSILEHGSFYVLNGIPIVSRSATQARKRLKERMMRYVQKAWDPEAINKPDPNSTIITRLLAALKTTQLSLDETTDLINFCLWGFHSNFIRAAVCCVAFIVRDTVTCHDITQHIRKVIDSRWLDFQSLLEAEPNVVLDDPDFAILDSVILETLRLVSLPSSFRQVLSDTTLVDEGNEYLLQKGELLAVDVYGMHYDAALFPEPQSFKPDRFVGAKTGMVKSLVPFGGGFLICRGRVYATYAIKMLLLQLFYLYDVTASSKEWTLSTNSITISDIMDHPPIHLRRREKSEAQW